MEFVWKYKVGFKLTIKPRFALVLISISLLWAPPEYALTLKSFLANSSKEETTRPESSSYTQVTRSCGCMPPRG